MTGALAPAIPNEGWDGPAGQLEWSCHYTLAHIVDALFWYAANAVRGQTVEAASPDVPPEMPLEQLVDAVRSGSELLAFVVERLGPDARGFHGDGIADRSGFASMGCDEMLIHAYDIAGGLGLAFEPPMDVAERTLRRLFPWAPADGDPWAMLLWANGRQSLGDRAPETDWLWQCAPLADWDGEIRRWR